MATRERPLSPHLQVYRWQIQMVTSILHRATGIILSVGALILAAALLVLMLGPASWNCFRGMAGAWYGQLFLFAWSWAFAYHLCNGLRHIVQDFGHGFSIPAFVRNSWLSVIGSLVIVALIWAYVLTGAGA
ncbi:MULTISPECIES: succinate dehydrogenase, cytochrome b556 subunit [Xanthomonas translucens group]|jgi:succinate dehydrogenase / fumarate reductase cytochrome b subunit|uniref:Succinate dehydrogenase cytochrome b556 subunit n=3 Tax=Xanthomonas translucens group TaxID=3390202 RepID=A0A0K2ZDR4_9XANT|nr:succinate dehydrogenase, cytochrome b556 subunit [Xanthomonas translucens]QDI03917.1 succinate dehydrogenase, cytochrome b556 subunit [Xanthomonas translucens pv. cerealis]UKE45894.1 succinate dehydrogenase, cytochrome b556 subunit [Xanthomonas translucens pv. cerealis]UKE63699.1 succinate dehydrogenase, cytochrome b556 subunit [Xanthomonas translucens pv. poae]UKE64430.1 succinate dehydrogenase, cytochrome b556 subunit [Xanthomonas translucens pv. phlei]UKE68239.1 succinate dehydrogenase, 